MSRALAFSAALLFVLAGCAQAQTPRAGQPDTSASAIGSLMDESPADVAHVECELDAVTVKDQVVRAQRDGVHLLVENPGGAWGVELRHDSWAYGTSEGFKLSDNPTPGTSAMAPGTVTIACVPTARSSYSDPGVPTATLTILDPDGLYVPWELACGFGEQFRMDVAAGEGEDPASVLRRVPGVMPSDDLERPKYPDSPRYWPMEFIVVRDGLGLARVMGPYYDGAWHLIVNACPDSGIHRWPRWMDVVSGGERLPRPLMIEP